MTKFPSLVLLIAGIALMIAGLAAADSIRSDLVRFFTGSPTDRSVWLLLGGTAAAVIGFLGLFRGAKAA